MGLSHLCIRQGQMFFKKEEEEKEEEKGEEEEKLEVCLSAQGSVQMCRECLLNGRVSFIRSRPSLCPVSHPSPAPAQGSPPSLVTQESWRHSLARAACLTQPHLGADMVWVAAELPSASHPASCSL